MNFRKLVYLIIAFTVATAVIVPSADVEAKKAKTTASSKNSNSKGKNSKGGKNSKNSKNSNNTKNSKNNKNSKNTKGKNTGKKKGQNTARQRKAPSQPKEVASNDSLTLLVNGVLVESVPRELNPGGLRVNLAKPDKGSNQLKVQLNESFTYLPVNKELIAGMEKRVKEVLPDSISRYSVTFNVGQRPYSYYISTIDKLPEKYRKNTPFVVPTSPYVNPKKGMEGDIVALWHSHGRYFKNGSWAWQRPFLFQTAEDIYTMSYVLPFLVPMLENAGAYVMLPRERDINVNEVIVDNDVNPYGEIYSQTTYKEMNGSKKWETGELEGFIYDIPDFRDTENPFENGTYRQVETVKGGKTSVAGWYADIPEDGEYAVYVSYKTLPNSTTDARYTVNYSGGSREFKVNQTMGGGTWIYLGTFPFKAGYSDKTPVVAVTNQTDKGGGTVLTADAVKIGGGKGNISRSTRRSDVNYDSDEAAPSAPPSNLAVQDEDALDDEDADDEEDDEIDDEEDEDIDTPAPAQSTPQSTKPSGPAPRFSTSGLPRFLEGARYWLHWAGIPESVYSPYHGTDDYKDDYTSRGHWVNYLAGGSRVLPNRKGLNIPVDISFALHTDAGKRSDDSFIGTLGIYYTDGGRTYADGTPRMNSRILTDMIMRQVTSDIRQTYEPRWTRRSMWDKSYLEARVAEVPTTLLELLSHQNFADMQYGLDPTFRFEVCRSIYKAMGRFISERKGREFVVQPLPVEAFAVQRDKKGVFRLSWQPVDDPLEPTAKPSKYIIMERTEGDLGFKKIGETRDPRFDVKVNDSRIHSVYVIAANEGGMSFPSEILAFREGGNAKPVLVVNGFTRVSGPAHFSANGRAGFLAEEDFGVPYKYDVSFSGYQHEFNRSSGDNFGRSGSNHVATVVGGNTFDYPAVHGEAIAAAGRGFVSASALAVEEGRVKLSDYPVVDLILGKQQRTVVGNGKSGVRFEAFPAKLRDAIDAYIDKGGKLIVSGQNISSDLYDEKNAAAGRDFAAETLGIDDSSKAKSHSGKLKVSGLEGMQSGALIPYSNSLRKDNYIVESADILIPAPGVRAETILTFSDTGDAAGLHLHNGKGQLVLMSVPFETITDRDLRVALMKSLLNTLD